MNLGMKKTFCLLLTLFFLNMSTIQANSADVVTTVNCGTFGYFTITNDAVTGNSNCAGNVVIPNSVTAIFDSAFKSNKNITSVTFGTNVKSIGTSAFNEANVGNLVIPGNVKTIGSFAFYQANISSLRIDEGVETIYQLAFQVNKNITSLTIPNSVTYIGDGAFAQWNALTNLTLGSGLKSIGEFSFYNGLLTSLLIPKNLESIGRGSFWDQPNLTQFQVDSGNQLFSSDNQGVLYDKKKEVLIQAPYARDSIVIPASVKLIEEYAFINPYGRAAKSLPSLVIPSTVAVPGSKLLEAISKAKADADAKAKAEAEARAAAEIRAKQEADAKAKADAEVLAVIKQSYEASYSNLVRIRTEVASMFGQYPQIWTKNTVLRASLQRALDYKYVASPLQSDYNNLRDLLGGANGISGLVPDFAMAQLEVTKFRVAQAKASKPTTITCMKGKITKKVTGISPKCPAGYKKK